MAFGGIPEDFVEVIFDWFCVFIRVDVIVALVGYAETDILNAFGEDVADAHREVGVLLFVVEAVIVVPQIVEELARISVHNWRQGLGTRHPFLN